MTDTPSSQAAVSDQDLARRTAIIVVVTIALVGLAALLWQIAEVLLLAFGSALGAALLHAIADPLSRWTGLSRRWMLPLAGLAVVAVAAGTIWLFETQVTSELGSVLQSAQGAITFLGQMIGHPDLARDAADALKDRLTSGAAFGTATSFGMTVVNGVTNLLLVAFGAAYLVAGLSFYRDGMVKLFPQAARPRIGDTIDTAARALRLWLAGQFLAMIITGTLTGIAVWLVGLPSALGLAVIAGVMEFIPLLGPFLGAAPAILVAISMGTTTVIWTMVAYLVIQQIESNLIQPLITRSAVSLPPLLLLFAFAAFWSLFGILGVLLAAPLTVVAYVAVKKLYVRGALGEATEVPGEEDA